jgi:hypothetical protein
VRRNSIEIELDAATLGQLDYPARAALERTIEDRLGSPGVRQRPISFSAYRRGSAFLDGRAAATP